MGATNLRKIATKKNRAGLAIEKNIEKVARGGGVSSTESQR